MFGNIVKGLTFALALRKRGRLNAGNDLSEGHKKFIDTDGGKQA